MKFSLYFSILLSTELVSAWSSQSFSSFDRRDELLGLGDKEILLDARQEYFDPGLSRLFTRAKTPPKPPPKPASLSVAKPSSSKPPKPPVPAKPAALSAKPPKPPVPAKPSHLSARPPPSGNTAPRRPGDPCPNCGSNGGGRPASPGAAEAQRPGGAGTPWYKPTKEKVQWAGAGLDALSSAIPNSSSVNPSMLTNVAKGACKLGAEACKLIAGKMRRRSLVVRHLVEKTLAARGLDGDEVDFDLKVDLARRWHMRLDEMLLDELTGA